MTQTANPSGKIKCEICGAEVHSIQLHLSRDHADLNMTVVQYQEKYPGKPILSAMAQRAYDDHMAANAAKSAKTVSADTSTNKRVAFHDLFGFPANSPAVKGARGNAIQITVLEDRPEFLDMVPDVDPNYVFNIDVLKSMLMALEMGIPTYLWGHAGTGKTTLFEQICAKTRRPMVRVQHTANMEEEHIVGGWRLRDGHTVFELGFLGQAMRNGWLYMADEYDFGRPEVTSVYQAVLEGKPLVIKEADPANRIIRPHPNFRFVATGNTNGTGDESGLYSGTNIQNAANYERFGVVEQMPYMEKDLEIRLVSLQANVPQADATKLVDFATRIREQFDAGKIGNTISPRSLTYAAKIGIARLNYRTGVEKAFINRLSSVDRETAGQVAQRIFA